MHFDPKQSVRFLTACLLVIVLAVAPNLVAQTAHVVSPSELQRATQSATKARQQDLEVVNQFLSSEKAARALQSAHLDPAQVKSAVASLNDGELAQLASRARNAQKDFAAGTLSDRDLIIVLVAIAALILIIVAVR